MKIRIVFILMLLSSYLSQAQIKQIGIAQPKAKSTNSPTARIENTTPITLPLWDDFSNSSGLLDTAWWMPGSQAQIISRPGNGILPPTLNVVTFDGVDAAGNPYSTSETDGPVDSLVSRIINLTAVPTSLRSSVYLSFFFQVKGNGNQPEPEDSLILYFKKSDGSWQKMWPVGSDIIPDDPTIFTEKLVNVPNTTDFFHPEFQFKFQAIGRQNGWFDNWNIDYIYMDKRRDSDDRSYLDRAITDVPISFLGQYTAMPFNEFFYEPSPAPYLTASTTSIRTLENDTQPIQYTAILRDTLNNIVLDTIANDVELIMFPKDVKDAPTVIPDPTIFNPNADSLYLEVEYFASTGDKYLIDSIYNAGADTSFYDHINLRVNDTARTYVTIHDYFAYDDGSAEYGAGINQSQGRIAYQFVAKKGQYIDHIDIYFPNIGRNQAGSPVEVFVLKDVDDVQRPYLGLTSVSIQHDGINKFNSYFFSKSVFVQDTFYIGINNLADDGLWTVVGLDKNNDTGSKMYYTIGNSWAQNTAIKGSLMMRPHFIADLVSGIEDFSSTIDVYPNPSTGLSFITGQFENLSIVDLYGREVDFRLIKGNDRSEIILAPNQSGLVILLFEKNGNLLSRKLIIDR